MEKKVLKSIICKKKKNLLKNTPINLLRESIHIEEKKFELLLQRIENNRGSKEGGGKLKK